MTFQSVDLLQKKLSETVFSDRQDAKKAAGRALGTLVEVIAFHLLKLWGLEPYIAIERRLPEYPDGEISHNVEYSLHPSQPISRLVFERDQLPLTAKKILKALSEATGEGWPGSATTNQLLATDGRLRNACTLSEEDQTFLVATLVDASDDAVNVAVHRLRGLPFAIAECKRVGVEQGQKKGPQTIEKAKQGAYVAGSVSSLQKIRLADGRIGGVMQAADGSFVHKPYAEFLREIVASDDPDLLRRFILTVGVVSNHGNWFTSSDHNKELKVLARAYDWLLFLTDEGLSQFVEDLIVSPQPDLTHVRETFLASYTGSYSGSRRVNRFTKVRMDQRADVMLQAYFRDNSCRIEQWFNVIAPGDADLGSLRDELHSLAGKDWDGIHR